MYTILNGKRVWRLNGGACPPDHAGRCCARSRFTGDRCRRWALKNSSYCSYHGGKRCRVDNPDRVVVLNVGLHLRYSRFLGKTLKERVEELNSSEHPLTDLSDEMAILRGLVVDSLNVYDLAEATPDENKRRAALQLAGQLVRESMNEVRDMAMSISRIENASKAKVDIAALHNVVTQITSIVSRTVLEAFDDEDAAQRVIAKIAVALDEELRIIGDDSDGPMSPIDEVNAMDLTVPAITHVNGNGHTNGHVHEDN